MKSACAVAFAVTGLLAACGGDVRVDGEPGSASQGQGGAGASSSSSSSSSASTTPSTSTGPVPSTNGTGPTPACDCSGACLKLTIECSYGDIPCDAFCQNVPSDAWQCVCNAPGCDVDFCFGGTGGAGTGGTATALCESCVTAELSSTCSEEYAACAEDAQCAAQLDCHLSCDWDPACNEECGMTLPDPYGKFHNLAHCAACGACFQSCSRTWLKTACALGGP